MAISIENLCVKYSDFSLRNISFKVQDGMITGIVGANGAGKTTIMKSIMNMKQPSKGKIDIFGYDNVKDEVKVKNLIGYVPADNYLHEETMIKNIISGFSIMYEQWDEEKLNKCLEKLNMPELAESNKRRKFIKVKELSKGSKVKLMLALALAHNPKVLVLDEPTSGLDPIVRKDVLEILRDFVENGENAVLYSSHITTDLDKVADEVVIIDNGVIVEKGRIDELTDKYRVVVGNVSDKKVDNMDIAGSPHVDGDRKEALVRMTDEQISGNLRIPTIEDMVVFFNGEGKKHGCK